MSKRTLSNAELDVQLVEQLGALQRSMKLFDDGYSAEAKRLAVILRVLFHNSRSSSSLLKLLGREDIELVDSSPQLDPENLLSFHGLVSIKFEDGEWSYAPKLDTDAPIKRTPLKHWWKGVVFSDNKSRTLTRADVVLTAANQDGGAHVDREIREDYAELRFGRSLGWTDDQGAPPSGDPRYVAIRQISHEVLKTLTPGYSRTFEDVSTSRKTAEISGGKIRFYPHERRFFTNNLAEPLKPDGLYLAEIWIASITTGEVLIVTNSTENKIPSYPGQHRLFVRAGMKQNFALLGAYTDAVINRVSLREMHLKIP